MTLSNSENVLRRYSQMTKAGSRDVRAYFVRALSYDAIAEIYERTLVPRYSAQDKVHAAISCGLTAPRPASYIARSYEHVAA